MPRQTSLQITEATDRQVEYLKTAGFGSLTEIMRIAVDRLYLQERKPMGTLKFDNPILDAASLSPVCRRVCEGQSFVPSQYQLLTDQPVDAYDRDPEHESAVIRAFDAAGEELIITNADIYYYTVVMEREQALAA